MELLNLNQYQVITSDFIKKCYIKNQSIEEVSRLLSLESEFEWEKITELDLSHSNIVHIVGLRLVTNLKHLRLTQNYITKIENIDWLRKLEHLDLSFNRISKIENIDKLTALKILNLGGNRISVLENMDSNTLLETFIITENQIVDFRQLDYMRRFRYLRFMDVEENPAFTDEIRPMIIDQFPDLLYLDCKQITVTERPKSLPAENGFEPALNPDIERLAFMYNTDGIHFFDQLYVNDIDGKVLSKWNSEVHEAYIDFRKSITESSIKVYDLSVKRYNNSIKSCFQMNSNPLVSDLLP